MDRLATIFLEGQDPRDTPAPTSGPHPRSPQTLQIDVPPSMQVDPATEGVGDLIRAGLRQTPLGAAYVALTRNTGSHVPQPGYNAFDDPLVKGTSAEYDYHDQLMGMSNPSETAAFLANAQSEENDRRALAVSPGGTVIVIAAYALNVVPVLLLLLALYRIPKREKSQREKLYGPRSYL